MPQVGFEPMIRAFKRAKTVDALGRATTVIGNCNMQRGKSKIVPVLK
jgi:hypothetical protein